MTVLGFLASTFVFAVIGHWSFSRSFKARHIYYSAALACFIFFLFFDVLGIALPDAAWSLDAHLQFL